MPRWFVLDERDQSTAVIDNTNTEDMHSFVLPYETTIKKTAADSNVPITTKNRYLLNEKTVQQVNSSNRIIPTPFQTIVADDAVSFNIYSVLIEGIDFLGENIKHGATDLMDKLGIVGNDYPVAFMLALDASALPAEIAGTESYSLVVTKSGATITGTDPKGLFHGLMSFIGLLDISNASVQGMSLQEMTIYDKPRFDYRGHQVDVGRNFRSVDTIKKTIDAMSLWKLNVLHLALTNDEGWRLEIPGLEELTSVGSKRCFDLEETKCLLTQLGSGPIESQEAQFYSRQEYIDILKYAQSHNVKVIPEFNMPAHARAAVISMEARAKNTGDVTYRLTDPEDETELLTVQFYDRLSIINPCLDSSVRFVQKLVTEVKQMHIDAGVPLDSYHFGGDEAKNILLGNGYASVPVELKQLPFSKSPACQAKILSDPSFDINHIANYWALKVNSILAQHGVVEMIAWEDGLTGTTKDQYTTSSVAANFWQTLFWGGIDALPKMADDGLDIIMANPDYLYFDFPYEVNPEERGYYWGARYNSVHKVFSFAPENLAQNAETSTDRDGNEMSITTPNTVMPTVRGMQGQTWSETIRSDDQYDEMAFPRVLAVAERAWHRASWELPWSPGITYNLTSGLVPKDDLADDFNGFVSVLGCREMHKMRKLGINYRVPPPGGFIDSSGLLHANTELPCTSIKYSMDGGSSWAKYVQPVNVNIGGVNSIQLLSTSFDGVLKSRVVSIGKETVISSKPEVEVDGTDKVGGGNELLLDEWQNEWGSSSSAGKLLLGAVMAPYLFVLFS